MLYFTPELYLKYNSHDDDVADQASEAWERAIVAYRAHLDTFRESLDPESRKLAESSFHDLSLEHQDSRPKSLTLTLSDHTTLSYDLWADVIRISPPENWPYSSDLCWLYDEVHQGENPNQFWHFILFGDGSILKIPFSHARRK